jgi:hypothetical protein
MRSIVSVMKRACWLGLACLPGSALYGQNQPISLGVDVRARIKELMQQTLHRSEGVTPEGVRVTWRATPNAADLEEVRQFGDAGIKVLSELLPTQSPRECQVTLRFLGGFNSSAVVTPLVAAIGDQRIQSNCRELSLRMLRDAPPELLKPSLEKAVFDSDPGVRRAASEMLTRIKQDEAK